MGQHLTRWLLQRHNSNEVVDVTHTAAIEPPAEVPSKRRRPRQDCNATELYTVHRGTARSGSGSASHFLGLMTRGGAVQSVCGGPQVERTYGSPYHLYPATDIGASHGSALGWDLRDNDLSSAAMLRLARVANAAKKTLVVAADPLAKPTVSTGSTPPIAIELVYSPHL